MKKLLLISLVIAALMTAGWADARDKALEQKIERLVQQVEAQQKRIDELSRGINRPLETDFQSRILNYEKELLAMDPGYRESMESWKGVLRDLRDRGLEAPLLAAGDGALGLWAALDEVYPVTEHQRCWNHRVTNVQAKLPKRLRAEARRRLREMTEAETRKACEDLRDRYVADLIANDQRPAAETVLRDWEDFVTFYHYPREHWIHLRTTNPLESIFSGVRLRTNAAKRIRRRDNALYLVFKIVERLSRHWRPLNGGVNLMTLVLEGENFKDGILKRQGTRELVGAMA